MSAVCSPSLQSVSIGLPRKLADQRGFSAELVGMRIDTWVRPSGEARAYATAVRAGAAFEVSHRPQAIMARQDMFPQEERSAAPPFVFGLMSGSLEAVKRVCQRIQGARILPFFVLAFGQVAAQTGLARWR